MKKSKPRKLRVLIINDQAAMILGYFDCLTTGDVSSDPCGFLSSQRFWANLEGPYRPPDLVITDINFDHDSTSPLQGEHSTKPTGLLHALPFLAWCRTSYTPTAIAFQTADPTLFQVENELKVTRVMRNLAVELAALARAVSEGNTPARLEEEDILDWSVLADHLIQAWSSTPGLALTFAELLPVELRKKVETAFRAGKPDDLPRASILKSLNRALARTENAEELFSSEDFEAIKEVPRTMYEARDRYLRQGKALTGPEFERLNRQILEALFPGAIKPGYQVCTTSQHPAPLKWIEEKTLEDVGGAIMKAVASFRKRLVIVANPAYGHYDRIVVDPEPLAQLLSYCEHAANDPDPEMIVRPDDDGWPGLGLILADGSRDEISVQSLFGEISKLRPGHFTLTDEPIQDPWALADGKPSVGAYLKRLTEWGTVYEAAVTYVDRLSNGKEPAKVSLNQIVGQQQAHVYLVRFLVGIFQAVRLYHSAWEEWNKMYSEDGWDLRAGEFGASTERYDDGQTTLQHYVSKMYRAIRNLDHLDVIDEEALLDSMTFNGEWEDWVHGSGSTGMRKSVRLLLDILVSLNLLTFDSASGDKEGGWRLVDRTRSRYASMAVPPCPDELMPSRLTLNAKKDNGGAIKGLAASLGFIKDGEGQYSSMGLLVKNALGDAVNHKTFWNGLFLHGTCPGWVSALGRKYAVDKRDWDEPVHWPRFLQYK